MKTQDLFNKSASSKKLNENFKRTFGKKINLEGFDLDQLMDARNKLRTQLSQMRSSSGFNENLENDAYHKAQWMLDAINAELAEREQHIADAEELAEGVMNQVDMLLQEIVAGEVDVYDILATPTSPVEQAASKILYDMYNEIVVDYKLHPDDDYQKIEEILVNQLAEKYTNNENQEENTMSKKVTEGEIQQASAIVTANTMVDRISRWIEELAGMENETLLQLGDSIRDEMGQEQAKMFISSVAPTIQASLETLKQSREEMSSAVRTLTGEESPMDMLGDEPGMDDMGMDDMGEFGDDEIAPADPDAMVEPEDEFGAADAASGGAEVAGRMKRESIDRGTNLMKILAG